MNSGNDWASSDPTQNITLAAADQFKNQLAAALTIQFGERFIQTASGETVPETEFKNSPSPAAPVNLWGKLVGVGAVPLNVAQMRSAILSAGRNNNPAGDLANLLHQAFPAADVANMMLRIPAVATAIGIQISQIS